MYLVSLFSCHGSSQNRGYTLDSASITSLGETYFSIPSPSWLQHLHTKTNTLDPCSWMQNLDIIERCKNINKQTKIKTNTYMQPQLSPLISFYQIILLSQNSSSVWHDQGKLHWGGSRLKLTNGPQKSSTPHNHSCLDAILGGWFHAKGHISFWKMKMHMKWMQFLCNTNHSHIRYKGSMPL